MDVREQLYKDAAQQIVKICDKMLQKENYMEHMPDCINTINEAIIPRLEEEKDNTTVILHVLEDMMYGMSQQDEVFLLDVLRYGMLPLFGENK